MGIDGRFTDEVQMLVDRLAAQIEQSVAIDDPDGNIIAISRHYGDEDGYRLKLVLERKILPEYHEFFDPYVKGLVSGLHESPLRVPAAPDLMIVGRIGYAIRDSGRVIAILWFIDRGRELPDETIEEYCSVLATILAERSRHSHLDPNLANDSLARVLAGESDAMDDTAIWLAEAQTEFYVLITPDGGRSRSLRIRGAAAHHLSLACTTRLNGFDVEVYGGPLRRAPEAESAVADLLELAAYGSDRELEPIRAVLAGPGPLSHLRKLFVEAALGTFVTTHLHRSPGVRHVSSLHGEIEAVLTPLDTPDTSDLEALKAMLLDPDGYAFDTLGAILRSTGTQTEIIEILRIHRTTLHYRLHQIEDRSGLNLQAPADMFLATLLWMRVALSRSECAPLLSVWRDLVSGARQQRD